MQLKETFENVKAASRKLNLLSDLQRNEILKAVADAIIAKKDTILEANALDLAKMGDLVRSRTYEAFFPLIAVMLIYFILEGILGTLVRVITDRMDPRKRKNGLLLKGVKEHD